MKWIFNYHSGSYSIKVIVYIEPAFLIEVIVFTKKTVCVCVCVYYNIRQMYMERVSVERVGEEKRQGMMQSE